MIRWLLLLCLVAAPIFAGRSRGKTALGLAVAFLTFATPVALFALAERLGPRTTAGSALSLAALASAPALAFGFSFAMLVRRRPVRRRAPRRSAGDASGAPRSAEPPAASADAG